MTGPAQQEGHGNRLLVIRTGGPQAGHSIKVMYDNHDGEMVNHGFDLPHDTGEYVFKMRQVPCSWLNKHATLAIGPGALIDVDLLFEEMDAIKRFCASQPHLENVEKRLFIDPNACIVSHRHSDVERGIEGRKSLVESIGSTGEGVGAATADLVMRSAALARDISVLEPYLFDTETLVHEAHESGAHIVVESTQGYGLSLRRSGLYPTVTSRDITVAQALNDAGIPSQWPHHALMVARTYPIRVAGPSGPFGGHELSWDQLTVRSKGYITEERTTVTNKVRRVAEFDIPEVKKAIRALQPCGIALTFADYWWPELADLHSLHADAERRMNSLTREFGIPVLLVGTGFQTVVEREGGWWQHSHR